MAMSDPQYAEIHKFFVLVNQMRIKVAAAIPAASVTNKELTPIFRRLNENLDDAEKDIQMLMRPKER